MQNGKRVQPNLFKPLEIADRYNQITLCDLTLSEEGIIASGQGHATLRLVVHRQMMSKLVAEFIVPSRPSNRGAEEFGKLGVTALRIPHGLEHIGASRVAACGIENFTG